MKKILPGIILAAFFFAISINQVSAATTTPNSLTSEEISKELIRIGTSYEVGEILSEEDAAFITKYGNKTSQSEITPMFSYDPEFSAAKTLNGVTVSLTGECSINHWNPLSNKFNCTANGTTNKGTVYVQIEHVAYGLLGKDEKLGKIYEKTFKSKSSSLNASLSDGDNYAGGVAVSTTTLKATATYGSTTVSAYDSY